MRFITVILVLLISSPLLSQDDKKAGNRCLRFDGKEDYVNFGDVYRDLKLPFTISMWVNIDPSCLDLAVVFASTNCRSAYSGFILVADRNYLHVQYGDGHGIKHPAFRRGKEASIVLTHSKWYHVTAVVKDNKNIELYLNGVDAGGEMTGESQYEMGSKTPDGFASAGYLVSNSVESHYKGAIDDIRLWNRALSPKEVANSMCNTLTGKETGLIGYWTFDELSGKVCYDKSPNKFHGKLVGSPDRETATIACGN